MAALNETVEGHGRCESLPDQLATLTPAVEGHVHDPLVMEGATVKKGQPIVEAHGGRVELDSAVGRGTRVSLLLTTRAQNGAGPT